MITQVIASPRNQSMRRSRFPPTAYSHRLRIPKPGAKLIPAAALLFLAVMSACTAAGGMTRAWEPPATTNRHGASRPHDVVDAVAAARAVAQTPPLLKSLHTVAPHVARPHDNRRKDEGSPFETHRPGAPHAPPLGDP